MRMTHGRRNEKGVAMLLALMAMLLVAGIATLMFSRTINEMRHSSDDTVITQTLMLARGGANIGSALLAQDIQETFSDVVELTATAGRWAFGDDTVLFSDDRPEPHSVVRELRPATAMLQDRVDAMVCRQQIMPEDSAGEVQLRLYFTGSACGVDLPESVTLPDGRFVAGPPRSGAGAGVQEYAIPFVLVSEARIGDFRRNIVMQGEYQFEVGLASFAQYAYFTNRDSNTSNQIWFTENTMIDGPTHTNGNFAFYQDPWFGGRVTSAGCVNFNVRGTCTGRTTNGAFFYDRPSTLLTVNSMSPSSNNPKRGVHEPQLRGGVNWNAQYVPLPDNAFDQRSVALGAGEMLDRGLLFDRDLSSLTLWAGNRHGKEPNYNSSNKTWSPPATHQFIEACWTVRVRTGTTRWGVPIYEDRESCETYRYDQDKLLQRLVPGADMSQDVATTWTTLDRPFNGVIYVEDNIARFRGPERRVSDDGMSAAPALARFSEITVVAEEDIRITRDLRYEQPPCTGVPTRNSRTRAVTPATCNNLAHPNVLGLYTPGGDIIVGNDHTGSGSDSLNAPKDVHVHAVLMSASDQIRVEGHRERNGYRTGDRGQFFLMGGMIQDNRGVFGTFSGSTRAGYDRVYTYDPRMRRGVAPPYFPTTGLDFVDGVRYFSFGQREQVY